LSCPGQSEFADDPDALADELEPLADPPCTLDDADPPLLPLELEELEVLADCPEALPDDVELHAASTMHAAAPVTRSARMLCPCRCFIAFCPF
jgi:hypothetical protein